MPKLALEVTTTAEVALKPTLVKKLKLKLDEYRQNVAQAKALKKRIADGKIELETLFADADEYAALEAGVTVSTPFGEVPVKMITGKTAPRLNIKKLMAKMYVKDKKGKFVLASPGDLDSCYDPAKDKKPYLGIYLPGDDEDEGE